jgi:PAS domain S-box-containing protein
MKAATPPIASADRSPLRRTEEELHLAEERYRQLAESDADLVCRWQPDSTLTYVNDAYCAFFRRDAASLLGTPWLDLLPADARSTVSATLRSLAGHPRAVRYEHQVTGPDGGARWQEWKDIPILDRSGRLVEFQSVGRDITARKAAEAALHRRLEIERTIGGISARLIRAEGASLQAEIAAGLESLGRFAHADRAHIYILAEDGRAMDLAHRWQDGGVDACPPCPDRLAVADVPWLVGALRRLETVNASPSSALPPEAAAERAMLADRNVRSLLAVPLLDGGQPAGFICFHAVRAEVAWTEDEVLLLRLAAELFGSALARERMRVALARKDVHLRRAQKMEALGLLAGGIAHDLNNALTSILGFVGIVRATLNADDPREADLAEAVRAADRAGRLTRQLMVFGRRGDVRTGPVSLNQSVLGIDALLRRTLGESRELVALLDEAEPLVEADGSQIEQVVMNLCLNARDATGEGGKIVVRTESVLLGEDFCSQRPFLRPGPCARLSVEDNGCGMAPEVLDQAFDPFFTTKGPDQGTGLGLATVYAIVRQFDGHVELLSRPGAGTRAAVYLPLSQRAPVPVPPPRGADAPGGREDVLLVEDDDSLRLYMSRILGGLGYRVRTAANGCEALRMASDQALPIDLLVTDVVMPQMGGPELVRRLREIRPGFSVLFVSGYTGHHAAGWTSGPLEHALLMKPFTREDLAGRVRAALDAAT